MFNIHRLKLPGHRRVGNGALFFSPGFRLRRAPRTSYQYLVRVRARGRGWNAPPSYASARVHQRKAKSAAPASDVAVATRSGILQPPYGRGNVPVARNSPPHGRAAILVARNSTPRGRGNVPVARNSHIQAAGTLPLPFDQILTTNTLTQLSKINLKTAGISVPSGSLQVPDVPYGALRAWITKRGPSKRMTGGGELKSAIARPGQPTKKKRPSARCREAMEHAVRYTIPGNGFCKGSQKPGRKSSSAFFTVPWTTGKDAEPEANGPAREPGSRAERHLRAVRPHMGFQANSPHTDAGR